MLKTNSYSQNLSEAILEEERSFVWLMKLFHRDYLDIQSSEKATAKEQAD